MIPKISKRYSFNPYENLHDFDELYFAGKYEHNLVCGVPIIDNKKIIEKQTYKYLSESDNSYSRVGGHPLYRKEISKTLEKEGYSNREYIATAGGTGGILLTLMSILDSEDEVILFDPDFSAYRYLTTLLGAKPIFYKLEGDFKVSVEKIKSLITTKTKAIVFSNPSNPLGMIVSQKDLESLAKISEEFGVWIVSDEVYSEYTYEGKFSSVLSTKSKNVISIRSFSKSGGLGGWRIGYTVASKGIIAVMRDVQEYSFICPSVLSQYVAAGILSETTNLTQDILDGAKDICVILKKEEVKFIQPEATFFISVIAPNGSGLEFSKRCFKEGIAVLPGILFSKEDYFIRLSLAGEQEKNLQAIYAFIKIYKQVEKEFNN